MWINVQIFLIKILFLLFSFDSLLNVKCGPQVRSPCPSSWKELRRMNGSWTCSSWMSTLPAGLFRTVGSYHDESESGFITHRLFFEADTELLSSCCGASFVSPRWASCDLELKLRAFFSWLQLWRDFDCWSKGRCCLPVVCFSIKLMETQIHMNIYRWMQTVNCCVFTFIIIACILSFGPMSKVE